MCPKRENNGGMKALVTAELLPRLKLLCPRADEGDLLFFGTKCDIASPIGVKYGVDTDAESVYNIMNRTDGFLRFSEADVESGFIRLTVSDETLEFLVKEAISRFGGVQSPQEAVETGENPAYARALLLTAAGRGSDHDRIPTSGILRRALWLCLMADSTASLAKAVSAVMQAICVHRRGVALRDPEMQLGPSAAGAMAACIGRLINTTNKEN